MAACSMVARDLSHLVSSTLRLLTARIERVEVVEVEVEVEVEGLGELQKDDGCHRPN
jgi:hypothetical protein